MGETLRRPVWIAFTMLVVAVAGLFCWLAWWQWQRYGEVGGSWQNVAYTLQWPVFAAFGVYMWWRMLRDVSRPPPEPAAEDLEAVELIKAEQERRHSTTVVLASDVEIDDELMAYNRYLASLNARAAAADGETT